MHLTKMYVFDLRCLKMIQIIYSILAFKDQISDFFKNNT